GVKRMMRKIMPDEKRKFLAHYSRTFERLDFVQVLKSAILPERCICENDILDSEDYSRSFIDRTLQLNPERRISALTALCHPFLQARNPRGQTLPSSKPEDLIELGQHIRRKETVRKRFCATPGSGK
ncbi:hypothetical protein PMAYCL1PPCAC_05164, partial [Pristionchus mayeri]